MHFWNHLLTTALALPTATAILSPNVAGMNLIWQDTFSGASGGLPDASQWNFALDLQNNEELETYTQSSSNIQISNGQTLQLVPQKSPNTGEWTSSRIESKGSWTPSPGKAMQVQAGLRTGSNSVSEKQGMWPAFWMLGDAMRHGTPWPLCGELDVFEQINGLNTGYGTVHCQQKQGGACNEPAGKGMPTAIPEDDQFHTWSLKIDRTSNYWQTEKIEWFMDGECFHTLTGAEIGDQGIWSTIAHSPMYIILNLAVGGTWPGNPNATTQVGWGSMMEVSYVAVYESS